MNSFTINIIALVTLERILPRLLDCKERSVKKKMLLVIIVTCFEAVHTLKGNVIAELHHARRHEVVWEN